VVAYLNEKLEGFRKILCPKDNFLFLFDEISCLKLHGTGLFFHRSYFDNDTFQDKTSDIFIQGSQQRQKELSGKAPENATNFFYGNIQNQHFIYT
jgi:hypothetical protein